MRGFTERPPELATEVRPRQAGGASQVIDVEWLEIPRVGQILGAQEMPGGRNKLHRLSLMGGAPAADC